MARKYSKKASADVERAMKKRKAGTLKSGRSGRTVKSKKQAIAIGLSEARKTVEPCSIVIFGASGDLTSRKLIPALYQLYKEKQMPPEFRVIGFARREKTPCLWPSRRDRYENARIDRLILHSHHESAFLRIRSVADAMQRIGVYPRCQPMVQLAHRRGAQPGCSKTSAGGREEGCNGGKPLSLNNIARLKNRVTMRAFQAGWAGNISFSRRRRPTECE